MRRRTRVAVALTCALAVAGQPACAPEAGDAEDQAGDTLAAAPAPPAATARAQPGTPAPAPERTSGIFEGMVTRAALGLSFAECATGAIYSVSREGAYAALERALVERAGGAGQPLLVRVRGSLARAGGGGGGEPPGLQVDAVESSDPRGGCGETSADLPLEGTRWELVELGSTALPEGVRATLLLDRSAARATGGTGCRPFGGPYRLEGARLAFGDLSIAGPGCAGPGVELEVAYLRTLGWVGGYRLLGTRLELLSEEGAVARFLSR